MDKAGEIVEDGLKVLLEEFDNTSPVICSSYNSLFIDSCQSARLEGHREIDTIVERLRHEEFVEQARCLLFA